MSPSPQSLTELTITGAGVGISIEESAQFGIVIAGLEVVERGLSILGLLAFSFLAHYAKNTMQQLLPNAGAYAMVQVPYCCSLGRLYLPWGSHSGRG